MERAFEKKYSVRLAQIAAEHALHVAYAAPDYGEKLVDSVDLNRPGIQLLGYLKHFDASRLQVVGKSETTLMEDFDHARRLAGFEAVMSQHVPAVIVAHDQPVMPECLEMAKKYQVSVLTTDLDTSEFYAQLIGTLRRHLAPRETVHGVLVEVHGEGMLITGDSGIGKSETALELIKRGHRLIADDAVEILRTSRSTLEGRAPAIIKHFMELRGIGVINVPSVFGIGAVRSSCPIDMVIAMELWDSSKKYDRLGLDRETTEYLGVSVPLVTIPVHPGRNLAVILELAAMTNRQRKSGYNAAEELAQRVDSLVDAGEDY
ncbi:MAG: HPr(Ser) kinase/phosphatase [Oscillospiraceae bacterium]|nr:HPr(Ser) kinase/phosphatase [Oscillospiraceae bacterium]